MFARHDTRCVRRSHGRRLCGDDTSIERLTDKCTRIVVCHFETHPLHEGIPKKYLHDITRRLPSDLDPNVAAEYLFDEFYWETRCSVLYPRQALLAEQHGLSWKQLFFEIHMQQHFEAFGGNDHVMPPGILTTLNACQDSIFTLRAEQLPGHPDLSQLLQKLHNITIVNLTYGVKKVGMNFDRMLFGMKASSVACCDFYYRCSTDCRC
mmetsp:Transcript_9505/g.38793  ORF Transcript_9505/g.38793 Transcript_9505/m.38793 type:complete len:208 (+) Transcript_9505:158-781(+)